MDCLPPPEPLISLIGFLPPPIPLIGFGDSFALLFYIFLFLIPRAVESADVFTRSSSAVFSDAGVVDSSAYLLASLAAPLKPSFLDGLLGKTSIEARRRRAFCFVIAEGVRY
ncbi:hypothetical protein MRX96_043549 [Rhipicephalus microplus]